MACECIKNVTEKIKDHLLKDKPDAKVIGTFEIENTSIMFGENPGLKLYSEVTGTVQTGIKSKKLRTNVVYTFCPFCGVKY